jgi:hypothetical protein
MNHFQPSPPGLKKVTQTFDALSLRRCDTFYESLSAIPPVIMKVTQPAVTDTFYESLSAISPVVKKVTQTFALSLRRC